MSFAGHYLSRNDVRDKIQISPPKDLRFVIVIPCFDEDRLTVTLQSIWNCRRPTCAVEVIVVVNSPENAEERIIQSNQKTIRKATRWAESHNDSGLTCYILDEHDLTAREAGPGLARKIGMDQAVLRFNDLDQPDGVIISLDADTTCQTSYLSEIERCFDEHPKTNGCSLYFEHPIEGDEFPEIVYRAISEYELHIRYYISALRWTGFPYAFHTIGSCFCVTAGTYVSQGGMNKRKAGEDFYFLQKVIPLGHFREINTTCLYPSPRPSARVPFGTGAVIKKIMEGKINNLETYHPGSFSVLKEFFRDPVRWYGPGQYIRKGEKKTLPEPIQAFTGLEFQVKLKEINDNSSTPETFIKRFYQWFNMFRVFKLLNFMHQKHFTRVPVTTAASAFLEYSGYGSFRDMSIVELLGYFRKLQREGSNPGIDSRSVIHPQ